MTSSSLVIRSNQKEINSLNCSLRLEISQIFVVNYSQYDLFYYFYFLLTDKMNEKRNSNLHPSSTGPNTLKRFVFPFCSVALNKMSGRHFLDFLSFYAGCALRCAHRFEHALCFLLIRSLLAN